MKAAVTCHSLPVKGLCLMPAGISADGSRGAVRTLKRDLTDNMPSVTMCQPLSVHALCHKSA